MPNRSYQKGARNERDLVKKMFENGAVWGCRSAGSHSVYDVVALFNDRLELHQVKGGHVKIVLPKLPKKVGVMQFLSYKKKGRWVHEMHNP